MSAGHHSDLIGIRPQAREPAPPGDVSLHPALAALPGGSNPRCSAGESQPAALLDFYRRYEVENAWLARSSGATVLAAAVLAARTAATQPVSPGSPPWADERAAAFLTPRPQPETLLPALCALGLSDSPALRNEADLSQIAACWDLAIAVETLLASGGDDRLILDPATGLNRYGCAPWPRPEIIGFASCTASSLTEPQFHAAELARRDLICAALACGPAAALAQATASAAQRISGHFGVEGLAEIILAASGTDAALIVTGLLAAEQPDTPLTSILVSPAETGSGVPDAVQGRHFSTCTPSGEEVPKGGSLDGLRHTPRLAIVALRDDDGAVRQTRQVAAACEAAISAALPAGRVVLHAIDGSKTGLTAPDRPSLIRLAKQFGRSLDIVIDACQARVEPALVRWYLQQGFPVLVTGSKFFAAPGFCGAVLFPRARLGRITPDAVPNGLAAYAGLAGGIGSRLCPGLLLRWTAALHSMAAFAGLPDAQVARRLDRLGHAAVKALGRDPRTSLVAAPRPAGLGWSDRRSVFTFMVRGHAGWLDAARLRGLYLALQDEAPLHCQIGQPVQLGSRAPGGLRLAFGAAQVCGGGDQADALEAVMDKLCRLLDRTGPAVAGGLAEAAYVG